MERDNIRRGALMSLCVVISLIALGALPAQSVGGVELRRINILSQLFGESNQGEELFEIRPLEFDEQQYHVDLDAVAREVAAVRTDVTLAAVGNKMSGGASGTTHESTKSESSAIPIVKRPVATESVDLPERLRELPNGVELTPIEMFSTKMLEFYAKLSQRKEVVRVAFLGDSFVEGDIMSADLREVLQLRYGGAGAGFSPFPTPLTRYRTTIHTTGDEWQSYNIMQRSEAPEALANSWMFSGWICTPTRSGASVVWECSEARKAIDSCSSVKVLFRAMEPSRLSVAVNGEQAVVHDVEKSGDLQHIWVRGERIKRVEVRVLSGNDSFVGYGAIFDDGGSPNGGGVVVDNYSIRSNNGQAILWCNPTLTAQLDDAVGGYDLVILQYGLNLLQRGVSNYSRYEMQIEKMIDFVRLCHPNAAVVVMGVSDRSVKVDGEYRTVEEARDMIRAQRSAAEAKGAAFWDTHRAMERRGGMAQFVKNRWAARDYTHINLAGGREIGRALAEAITCGEYLAIESVERGSEQLMRPMLSSEAKGEIERVMAPKTDLLR